MAAMINEEENRLLTETGPGKPCGTLMRRYWQPAALSEELTADKPLPVKLLSEELILFRCDGGRPALIGRYCAHQGVDMIYGRVEEDGLRCMYHGWLFDSCGKVIVRGGWVEGGEKRMAVGQPAYPCEEARGIIFTYMGSETPPPLPNYEFIGKPTKTLRDENFLQGISRNEKSLAASAMFLLPSLVTASDLPPGAERRIGWHVPIDNSTHLEFVFRCVGQPSLTRSEPLKGAREILAEAIVAVSDSENG